MEVVRIFDEDNFLRRVPTFLPNYIKEDGSISRLSFTPKRGEDGLSGDLERLSSFEKATLNDSRYRLLKINIGVIRNDINDGLDVIHNPIQGNEAHCLLIGKITDGKAGKLLKNSTEVMKVA